jgi:ABC-type transport system involved in multi-copper enzyme maturation permease subunit
MARWKPNPVFISECRLAARRWQTYAVRTAFLSALLVCLLVVWASRAPDKHTLSRNELARIGESFFLALGGAQLALVLLAAPAYAAGAVCLDRARGTLAHVLVTDLSASEVVLGKLGARLLPVLGLVLSALPILGLVMLLGGIDPEALLGSFLVTVGVALVGCSLALALSVRLGKPHEVLLACYLAWALLILALPAWNLFAPARSRPPAWLEHANPFWLSFACYQAPERVAFADYLVFLGVATGLAALLTLRAAVSLRRSALPAEARAPRRRTLSSPWFGPSLDLNPVLWREWHRRRPSRWLRLVWGGYLGLSLAASVAVVLFHKSGWSGLEATAFVNAFQFSIGLLLVSVLSVTSLFEERVRGSLDVLLATPLSTSAIVWGKWWGGFRSVLLVTFLPALLACILGLQEKSVPWLLVLLILLMLAYRALVNSLGLALAVWVSRFGVAVALSVSLYVVLAAGSVLLLLAVDSPGRDDALRGFAVISPWYGVGETTFQIVREIGPSTNTGWKLFWLLAYVFAALWLVVATRIGFVRRLGRVDGHTPPGASEE